MIHYMLDTDISSYIIKGTDRNLLDTFAANCSQTCISSITAAELRFGARKRNNRLLTEKVNAFCQLIPIVNWTDAAAQAYAKIRTILETAGTPIGSMDMLIAASAMENDCSLVTNNTSHFSRIPGLKLAFWTQN